MSSQTIGQDMVLLRAFFGDKGLERLSEQKMVSHGPSPNEIEQQISTSHLGYPASCITFLSEQAFAPQNTRFWSRRRVWFQFTVGEDKAPMLSVDNRGKGVLSMDCSAKRSPL